MLHIFFRYLCTIYVFIWANFIYCLGFFFFFTIYIFLFERGKETERGKQPLFLKMLQQLRLSHSKCKNPELKYWTVKYCHVRCVLTWSWIRSRVTSWFEPADSLICDVGVPSSNLIWCSRYGLPPVLPHIF